MEKHTTNKGWVSIHRKLLDNPIASKPNYLSLWVHLLLMANHCETSFIWNNKKQILKEGQLLTGLKELSTRTGIAQTTVHRILKYLEDEKQIKQEKTTKYTLITIVNWNKYQEGGKQKIAKSSLVGTTNKDSHQKSGKQVENKNTQKTDDGISKHTKNGKQNGKQKTMEYPLIDTTKGDSHQQNGKQNGKQMENKWKTNGKQMETYNNNNNINNENNIYISKDIGDKSQEYGNKSITRVQEILKEKYPKPLDGITDRRKIYNLIQVLTKRKNQDEWMSDDWKMNLVSFMNTYLANTQEEYLVRSISSLKNKAKLWREYRGKLN